MTPVLWVLAGAIGGLGMGLGIGFGFGRSCKKPPRGKDGKFVSTVPVETYISLLTPGLNHMLGPDWVLLPRKDGIGILGPRDTWELLLTNKELSSGAYKKVFKKRCLAIGMREPTTQRETAV